MPDMQTLNAVPATDTPERAEMVSSAIALHATIPDLLAHYASIIPDEHAHTFIDYLASPEGVRRQLNYAQWDRWVTASAAAVAAVTGHGDVVAILLPQGSEYAAAFLGILRAGRVAVPLFPHDMAGHAERLATVLADCSPAAVITSQDRMPDVESLMRGLGRDGVPLVSVAGLDGSAGDPLVAGFHPSDHPTADTLAYLQYTSGSTRAPAGVELTHGNLVANCRQISERYSLAGGTAVSWLPLFHDMGLVLGVACPIMGSMGVALLDPLAFLLDPSRWITEMGSHGPGVFSAAPNFAFDLAVRKTREPQRHGLDLSGVAVIINGAEPVNPVTVNRFHESFAPHGLRASAVHPSYGLAEATVMATTAARDAEPRMVRVSAARLQQHEVVPTTDDGDATTLVACGPKVCDELLIVDPDTRCTLPDGRIGEVWLRGSNIGRGYWSRPEESEETFGGRLADDPGDKGGWLRTGDLGTVLDGEVLITGRRKDLMIVGGRNIYPHDVEHSVANADEAIALNRLAAFAVVGPQGEAVVVVAEAYRRAPDPGSRLHEIESAARDAVVKDHSVPLRDFVLIEPDTIPRTSSGKIARQATRVAYLEGTLSRVPRT